MFHAERVLGGGQKNRVYHKKCAHCASCEKPLNSMILCNGKDLRTLITTEWIAVDRFPAKMYF